MAVSTSIKKRRILNEMSELDEGISRLVNQMGLDSSEYGTAESVIRNIDSWLQVPLSRLNNRFTCSHRLWKSIPKLGKENHWMYDTCTSDDDYIQVPMDEEYGRMDYLETGIEFIQENDIFGVVSKHITLYKKPGLAALVYSEARNEIPVGDGSESRYIDVDSFVRRTMMIHPYYGSPSFHEAFKLLLEWQWAYYYADSIEPMAVTSNEFLLSLGLDVRRNGVDPVVSAFMTLPDQQVAQYFKTGTCSINEDLPECPLDVKIWLIEKGIIGLDDMRMMELSNLCIRKIKAQRSYDAIN